MDFANLDLKKASRQGSWVHLEYDRAPLFLDDEKAKPCRVHVRGMADPKVMDACRAVTRLQTLLQDRLARASDKDAETVLKGFEAKSEEATANMILAAVDEWENIVWEGEPLELTSESLLQICGPGTLFFKQVSDAILEHKRLFSSAVTA